MSKIEVIPVDFGNSVLAEDQIFQNGSKDKTRPIVFRIYVIKTAEKIILVDAGCVTMPGFDMQDFIGPKKALEKYNITPEDITDVIITHSHHDHIECINMFDSAKVYIQQDEYESGKGYFEKDMQVVKFDDFYDVYDGVKVIKIGGHSIGSSIVEVTDGEEKYVIAGDECYIRECLDRQMPTGASYCIEKSREFIKKYASGEYKVLLCHSD